MLKKPLGVIPTPPFLQAGLRKRDTADSENHKKVTPLKLKRSQYIRESFGLIFKRWALKCRTPTVL